MPKPYPARELGQLPVEAINKALGTELEPGRVWLSAKAHQHMAEDHPEDYDACMAALPLAIAIPTFVGQAPVSRDNFEIVRRINCPDGRAVLVAIGMLVDERGQYRVKSCYLISAEKVDARRQTGRLRGVRPS